MCFLLTLKRGMHTNVSLQRPFSFSNSYKEYTELQLPYFSSQLIPKQSIRPFSKKHTTFLKRGKPRKNEPLLKHHLNGIKTPFKRYYNSMEIMAAPL